MNEIKSFSIFPEYVDLISLLSEEEQGKLYLKIINYVFNNIEPNDLTDNQRKVWVNLKRPIDKSIKQSQKANKRWVDNNAEVNAKQYAKQYAKVYPKRDAHSKMSMSNVNVLEKKKIGYGEEKEKPLIKEIVEYLNKKCGTNFRSSSKTNQSKINARLNEGYNLDDFIVVIDKKFDEWNGTEFEKHLCPETLFGTKFEKYLNQKVKNTPEWFNKNFEKKELNESERREIEAIKNGTWTEEEFTN